jgi:hypothetical protein
LSRAFYVKASRFAKRKNRPVWYLRVEVSRRIKEEFENGRDYYALSGRQLAVTPESPADQPSREFLEWHRRERFVS